MQSVKIVCVGDDGVGKSSLVFAFQEGVPTADVEYGIGRMDNYQKHVMHNGRPHGVTVWDTQGNEDYDRLRPLAYPQTDAFLVCFSCVQPDSLAHALAKFVPEIRQHAGAHVPILLVATQTDRRTCVATAAALLARGSNVVTRDDAERARQACGAAAVVECCAHTNTGVAEAIACALTEAESAARKHGRAERRRGFLGGACTLM